MLDQSDKAKFILALHKHSLQAFAEGGTALAGPGNQGVSQVPGATQSHGIGGFFSDLLGTSNNFSPTAAQTQMGTNGAQLNSAYSGNQLSLQQQQQLLQQIQAQNGLGNQSQVYNQLQGVANGTGPNPAQAMLGQATGANIASQAALMAGQRGASANAGLIARQAAQQGGALQQNAAGQAATLQANQSLNAIGMAGNLANQQASNQIAATNANTTAQQGEQGILQNANNAYNNGMISQQQGINTINAGVASGNTAASNGILGGIAGAIGGGAVSGMFGGGGGQGSSSSAQNGVGRTGRGGQSLAMEAHGGMIGMPKSSVGRHIYKMANGGEVPGMDNPPAAPNVGDVTQSLFPDDNGTGTGAFKSVPSFENPMAPSKNDRVRKMLAPDFNQLDAMNMSGGGAVPGKAKVHGDSYSNDTVSAKLSPGELVVDRETMNDKGPAGDAARFLAAVIASKKARKRA